MIQKPFLRRITLWILATLILGSGTTPIFGQANQGPAVQQETTLLIRESPENLVRIEQILKSLDLPPKQVLIEAHIFDVTLDDQNATGLDWSALMTQIGRSTPLWQYDHTVTGAADKSGIFRFGNLNNEHFQLLLQGLRKYNKARSLSNPKITAISGQGAVIELGQKIPYFELETTTTNNTIRDRSIVRFQPVPITLTVTPIVYDDDTIRMRVVPEVTSLLTFIQNVPWTERRTAETEVIIRNGETLILGGLITERKSEDNKSVPVFDRIPLVRKLFTNKEKSSKRSELVVFITPNIINSQPVRLPRTSLTSLPGK